MNAHIWKRIEGLESGKIQPQELIVPGVFEILNSLNTRGVKCYLASGTGEQYVTKEAAAIKLANYFCGIFGARDDYHKLSKKLAIENIMRDNQLSGPELIAFGDGYVEIGDTHLAGCISVGVATNEACRHGIDLRKRKRLIDAGADIIIPDFRNQDELGAYLFAGGQ